MFLHDVLSTEDARFRQMTLDERSEMSDEFGLILHAQFVKLTNKMADSAAAAGRDGGRFAAQSGHALGRPPRAAQLTWRFA